MAIASVGNRGTATGAPSLNSGAITLATGGSIVVGNHLIMVLTADNAGGSGSTPFGGLVVTDPRGNVWTRLQSSTRSPGGVSNDGSSLYILIARVQFAYANADAITITWTTAAANRIVQVHEFSGIRAITYPVVGPISTGATSAAISVGAVVPSAAGQMVFAATSFENGGSTIGNDADGIQGVWAGTMVSTVGAGVTGQMQGYSFKIVSGTASQTWDVAGGTSSDWTGGIFVLDFATAGASTNVQGNPNYPCLAGFEGLPLESATVPVDQGTVYHLQHTLTPATLGTGDYTVTAKFAPPANLSQHTVAWDLYANGNEDIIDEVVTVVIPLSKVTLGAGAAVIQATPPNVPPDTGLTALQSLGGAYVQFDTNIAVPNAFLYFNTTNLQVQYGNLRVVRVGLRYQAWKEDTSPANPGEGFDVSWNDTLTNGGLGASALYGSWLADDYQNEAQFQTRWLGETNIISRGVNLGTNHWRMPFTVADLAIMRPGVETGYIQFRARAGYELLQTKVNLDYCEMIVELVPERRAAVAQRFVSNLLDNATNNYRFGWENSVEMRYPFDTAFEVAIVANDLVLATREAIPPTGSDRYRVRSSVVGGAPVFTFAEAVGPSLQVMSFRQPRPSLERLQILDRGTISNGLLVGPTDDFDQYTMSVIGYDAGNLGLEGAYWVAYSGLATELDITVAFNSGYSFLLTAIKVDGLTTFDAVKVLVKPDPLTTTNLTFTFSKPGLLATATVTVAQANSAPDVGNGWREISVPLSVPITPTAGNDLVVQISSTASVVAPWRIAAAQYLGTSLDITRYFGYNSQGPNYAPQDQADYAVVLQCPLAEPDLQFSTEDIEISRAAGRCVAEGLALPFIQIENGDDFDYMTLERSVDGGFTWVTLIAGVSQTLMVDYGYPWDLGEIIYRVTGYRRGDRRSSSASVMTPNLPWSTSGGVAFGLADMATGVNLVYAPVGDGGLEVKWSPLNPIDIVQRHAQDYQVALRAPEERGLSVSAVVLVDSFVGCTNTPEELYLTYLEHLAAGTASFSPVPYDALRAAERSCRLVLQLPGGHTRFVSLDLGSLNIRTSGGVYLAEIELTDVAPPNIDPYS